MKVIHRPPKYLTESIFGLFGDIFTLNEKNIIATLLKFTGYIHNHKILPGNIFGLILKNKMAVTGISLSVMKSAYISLIIGPIFWKSFGVVRFDLGPNPQRHTRIAKLKSAYNSLIIGRRGLGW